LEFAVQGSTNAGRSQLPASCDTRPSLDIAGAGCAGAALGLPRFSAIRPEHVLPALDRQLADSRALLEERFALDAPCTWDNFAQPLEDMRERLSRLWSPVSHLNAVVNSPALREVYNAGLPKLSEFFTELAQDERVYAAYVNPALMPTWMGIKAITNASGPLDRAGTTFTTVVFGPHRPRSEVLAGVIITLLAALWLRWMAGRGRPRACPRR